MRIRLLFTCVITLITATYAKADTSDETPTISPTAIYVTDEGEEESTDMSGNAPLTGRFQANPQNVGEYSANYEWRFTVEGETTPYLTRYEENTEYTFTKAGTHNIVVYATFINGNDTIAYTQDYWDETGPMRVTISESKLEMPNAFSPNGDGIQGKRRLPVDYRISCLYIQPLGTKVIRMG